MKFARHTFLPFYFFPFVRFCILFFISLLSYSLLLFVCFWSRCDFAGDDCDAGGGGGNDDDDLVRRIDRWPWIICRFFFVRCCCCCVHPKWETNETNITRGAFCARASLDLMCILFFVAIAQSIGDAQQILYGIASVIFCGFRSVVDARPRGRVGGEGGRRTETIKI